MWKRLIHKYLTGMHKTSIYRYVFNQKRLDLTLYIILFFVFGLLQAQTESIVFKKYGIKEGLPEEWARKIIQDNDGFIWVLTQNGVVKYDGYNVQQVNFNDLDRPEANIFLTSSMMLGKDGKIWIGGRNQFGGISCFDPKLQKTTNHKLFQGDSLMGARNYSSVLLEDVVGDIWFVSEKTYNDQSGELCRLDVKSKKIKRYGIMTYSSVDNFSSNFNVSESKKDSSFWLVDNGDVHRFDRKKNVFKLIFSKGDTIPGTSHNDTIQDMTPSRNSGLIPMGNSRHLYLWDPIVQKAVESYSFPAHENSQWIGSVFEDQKGDFWVSSSEHLVKVNRKTKTTDNFVFGKGTLEFEGVSGTAVAIIPVSSDDRFIWFIIRASASPYTSYLRYDLKKEKFTWFDYTFNDVNNEITDRGSSDFYKDRSGVHWIGYRPNFYKQEPKKSEIKRYLSQKNHRGSIPSDTINYLLEDSKEQLWVGTVSGLAVKDKSSEKFRTFSSTSSNPNSLSDDNINYLFEDSESNLWIATDLGVERWERSSNSFERILHYPSPQGQQGVYRGLFIAEDKDGKIWISIQRKGVFVVDKTGRIEKEFLSNSDATFVHHIFHDSKGNTWLSDSQYRAGLYRVSGSNDELVSYSSNLEDPYSLVNDRIFFTVEDRLQNLWIGTNGGLLKYKPETDNFKLVKDFKNAPCVNGYCFDIEKNIWFMTYVGGGIINVDQDGESVTAFGEDQGLLHNDTKNGIDPTGIVDDTGKIWVPTQRGLSAFDPVSYKFTNYSEVNGYYAPEGNRVETLKSSQGEIWIGGSNGLYRIDPQALLIKDTIPPEVHITSMKIMDSVYDGPDGEVFELAVSYSDKIELAHWQKDIAFDFVALHYANPESNQYSWILEPYDKNWSEPSFERKALYTNLPHGTYTFKVKASNADGIWSKENTSIEIKILPPWWQTWWAYLTYFLILIVIALKFHKYQKAKTVRIEREKSQEKELLQAKEIEKAYTELKSTQAQLIQSEKMASLGELTAGIAHEIQNPLNFVKNFSEVSTELIDEMVDDLKAGKNDEVLGLAEEIKENQERINHHGKRAGSIVRGMLQHSRSSSGELVETDLNALSDEYLRLSYHGLRAKDKSFNADLQTDFEKDLPKIKVVPQDFGRVLLNLINNAFYAVKEKSETSDKDYKPMVKVSTKLKKDLLEIKIADNGNGIPEEVKDKIFQPFFTTKPTGKGTGLGLSLSYDIVKAHRGELKVESEKNKGTEFTIKLPLS